MARPPRRAAQTSLLARHDCLLPPCPGKARPSPPLSDPLPAALSQASEEDELRKLTTGMTAGDAIKRILLAAKDRDYFRCGPPLRPSCLQRHTRLAGPAIRLVLACAALRPRPPVPAVLD